MFLPFDILNTIYIHAPIYDTDLFLTQVSKQITLDKFFWINKFKANGLYLLNGWEHFSPKEWVNSYIVSQEICSMIAKNRTFMCSYTLQECHQYIPTRYNIPDLNITITLQHKDGVYQMTCNLLSFNKYTLTLNEFNTIVCNSYYNKYFTDK